ncbi:MAG: hypothetical protein Q4P23_11220 [Micrococcaceae bacterium]|nr:hypothetical protein [Micrococcaceae bacterium]
MKKSPIQRTSISFLRTAKDEPTLPGLGAPPHMPPVNEIPTCERCNADTYLVYERITLLLDAARVQPPCWDVEFWCGQCESFYGILTTLVPVDHQAVRLAAENPRYVRYPASLPRLAPHIRPQGPRPGYST